MNVDPYTRNPVESKPWNPLAVEVIEELRTALAEQGLPEQVEHIGSTAVPGLLGKGVVDAMIAAPLERVPPVVDALKQLGFQGQPQGVGFPTWRPLLMGDVEHAGNRMPTHVHVIPDDSDEVPAQRAFVAALRDNDELRRGYAELKEGIVAAGVTDPVPYSIEKIKWVLARQVENKLPILPDPEGPPPSSVQGQLAKSFPDD